MKNANLVSLFPRRFAAWAWLSVALVAGGVAGCSRPSAPVVIPAAVAPASTFFPIAVGGVTVRMQLAVSSSEQQRGLMQRRDLGADEGMLFPYQQPQTMSFWMHNTPTPLDIGFFDAAGVLMEIYPLQPFDEASVRSRSKQLKYALEVNQGWFAAHQIRVGAQLDLAAVTAGLRARGADWPEFENRN